MSFNQSKTEKNDAFYRKSGRSSSFNQQRGPSGGHGRGSGGPAPASSLSANRSFSKKNNNAQGGQYRVNPSPVNSTEPNSTYAARTIHNGTHVQPPMHGASDGPVAKVSESAAAQRSPRVVPNAPTSQPPPVSSDTTAPTSSAKGDTSKAFPFQFGSIAPGVMNGVAIPARTSSAPPNLDEQKRDQARHDSIKPVPSVPIPTVPKQQQPPRNDAGVTEKTNARDTHPGAKSKKDPQAPALTPASQMQRPSVVPVPGISMSTPFQQSQASLQFGGSNPQIQSQGMSSTPMHIPIPMPIPIGNVAQVQQPVFIPGLQPHPMHPHGMMHPGHNLSFAHQMGHQLPHQLGNMSIGTGPPYPQQQGGNFTGPRKTTTVKITHPETHEELRLDKRADGYSDGGSSGARPHPNVPSQSQPVKSVAVSQPTNYYPSGPYSSSPPYYQPSSSLPLTSNQITPNTQPPIFNYPVNNGPQNVAFMNSSSLSSLPVNKVSTPIPHIAEPPIAERSREVPKVTSSAPTGVSVTIKPSGLSAVTDSALTNSSIRGVQNPETSPEISTQHSKSSEDSSILNSLQKQSAASVVTAEKLTTLPTPAVTEDSVSVVTNNEANMREPISWSNSSKDNQKKSEKIGQSSQDQVSVQSPTAANLQSQAVDSGISDTGVSTPVGSETNHSPAIIAEDLLTSEGSIAEADDSLSNRKHDKIDESSEDLQSADLPETTKEINDSAENACSDSMSLSVSGTKDRPNLEPNKAKITYKGKKKRKEILQKADAAGTTSDLYNAYKGPDEKKETVLISESSESESTSEVLKQLSTDSAQLDATVSEEGGHNKAEPDDWEDAADISTPKLEVDDKSQQVIDGSTEKKYSRDFLLKFAEQCITLPEGFEIKEDIAEALMSGNINNSRDSHPSPGRTVDRSRMERRGNVVADEDKWNKVSNVFNSGRVLDGNGGFRQGGQGGSFGVLRNPRGQAPPQFAGGILSGPLQSGGHQGGTQRNSPDGERWQRSTSFQQRGLIPSPQSPLQMMHKAEKKYEIGKVSDAEEAKQRQLKAILNKLTPQNFDRLFEQVKAVNIDNAITLTGVISQIFEKALMEPTFCEMYANFCSHLASELPDLSVDNEKITFKRLLLNKCQEEFERGEREQEEANKVDEAEGEVKLSNEEREQRRTQARRRMLGNIRLIGELYKKKMLTERIMHECIKKLLGQCQDPDEEDVEALCKLMSTIGEMIDHPKAKEHMDVYFERLKILSNNMNLSSRVRFMLKDVIDLRRNRWQVRRKVDGPKKIEEVHRDAVQERQAQAQAGRMGRGMGNNQSARRNPMDFGPRGSPMLSPTSPMGGPRGMSTQARGYGLQDARFEEKQSYEPRTLSVNFTQRPLGNDSITLVPQGGLARGMSSRGSTISSIPDVHSGPGDSHRMPSGINGFSNLSERTPYGSREDLASRYMSDRPSSPAGYDHSSAPAHNTNYGNRDLRNDDRNLNRPVATSPHTQSQGPVISQNASSEERLRDMSLSAIREYYSARDVNEVAQCIKDLNSPNFHPSMVSLWVTDSFERKDTERGLLAKLLVKLGKSQDGLLSQTQLVGGFETVLGTLEDAVNDAPKAPEFLGRIFAELITESLVSLNEIGQLVHNGGEEPGSLLEFGLAADVLGSTLEAIKHAKGDAVLSEIRTSSNLRLESFRPPNNSSTSRKLEQFI